MGKMAACRLEQGEDAFRKIFRLYKRRNPPPDLSGVVEFTRGHPGVKPKELTIGALSDQDACRAGLQPLDQWKVYGLEGYPGFLFVSNPFLPGWQHRWVRQCLKVYPQKPNVCNLDLHMRAEQTANIWESSKEQLRERASHRRSQKSLLEKLRWVTLGYHYNWDTKKYSVDHHSTFPPDLAELSRCVSRACGFSKFQPEAGILNYYHMDSSLGIHVDESELDQHSPLLSFCFGQSCIYLLGGLSRELAPTPMMMHSGDIMIMAGPSRLLYHAVPRILPHPGGGLLPPGLTVPPSDNTPPALTEPCSSQDWEVCAQYLHDSRINMTVRQVLEDGCSFPVGEDMRREQTHANEEDSYHQNAPETPAQEGEGQHLLTKRIKTT
ncbi:nucleic acid dioxygenase ALKBH1 [Pelobates cultripes]|uniref:Nucleic acid dioxygenase ALKBH1 n=1 Tax=Pelobates cultripes TaxID=61616 RepID=A0AAD1TPG4_PELCU|nr:nucleic acid dioxygenase ALKBH1 [Pelobates cultripes]